MAGRAPERVELEGLSAAALRAIAEAEDEARDVGLGRVGTEHLLLGVLATAGSAGAAALLAAGVQPAAARRKVSEAVNPNTRTPVQDGGRGALAWSPRAERALGRAFRFSKDHRAPAVGTSHLLLGVLDVEGTAGQVLRGLGTDVDAVRATLIAGASTADVDAPAETDDARAAPSRSERRTTAAARCPSCGVEVEGRIVHQVLTSRGGRGERDVVVFSCAGCGTVLGVAPPPSRQA